MNDPFFGRLLETLTAPAAGYVRQITPPDCARVDLGIGEARYPLPAQLLLTIGRTSAELENLWYTTPDGEQALQDAYRTQLSASESEPDLERDSVLVTAGGKEAAWLAVRYLLYRGRAAVAVVPSPGWEPYRLWLNAAGCPHITYDPVAVAEDPTLLRQLIINSDQQPGLIILNYPNNPTGVGVTHEAMNDMVQIATDFGWSLLSDEVYRVFGVADVSAVHAPARDPYRHLVIDSCSKALTVAGLRVGFLVAHRSVVEELSAFRASYASCTSVLNQRIATALLTDSAVQAWLASVRVTVERDRIATVKALTEYGIEVTSHGGLYIWSRTPDRSMLPPLAGLDHPPAALITSGAGFGASDHFRLCTARADLDPAGAAAAVVTTLRRQR
ncbi:pyridoxal phosphate-dependent aminotransferase [Nocardia sp. NPDC049220]|uniref:pyridoxal phosphate-dependent aminotransferase n=1 Tax=Nocardia sp. NPDC049220 TaxID=3155273 RepID=UPI0033DB0724